MLALVHDSHLVVGTDQWFVVLVLEDLCTLLQEHPGIEDVAVATTKLVTLDYHS